MAYKKKKSKKPTAKGEIKFDKRMVRKKIPRKTRKTKVKKKTGGNVLKKRVQGQKPEETWKESTQRKLEWSNMM